MRVPGLRVTAWRGAGRICPAAVVLAGGLTGSSAGWSDGAGRLPADSGSLPLAATEGSREVHELMITVDGATIRALCTDGPRDVLLLHDTDSSADVWRPVLERLDGRAGACAYDRRGSGRSVPAPVERGWYELLDELGHVHRALGFDRDYLLVAHGLGASYARLYVADRPREVGALLLVDPAHEEMPARYEAGMPARERREWIEARSRPNEDGIRESALDARLRSARTPRIPVTVLTATDLEHRDGWDLRFIAEASRQLHAQLLRGAAVPRHIPADRSGHDVPLDQPQLVVEEILRLRGFLGR